MLPGGWAGSGRAHRPGEGHAGLRLRDRRATGRDRGAAPPDRPRRRARRRPVRNRRARSSTVSNARSRPTGPTCTCRRAASPRSSSATTSRPTSPGATSRSTRWRCGSPTRCWSIRTTARSTSSEHRLRTPLSPDVSFTDDPLRMLRAARFIAGFGFEPVPELVAAVGEHRHRLEIVSAERIRDELSKLLVVDDPAPGLWFLARTRLSDEFLPELNAMRLEQDPIHHHKDVLAHTIAVVQKVRPDLVLRLAALLHDVGKPKTRSFEQGRASLPPPRGRRRAHGARAAHGVALPQAGGRGRHPAGVPAPPHPHVRDGLDRQCGAAVRARRRTAAREAQRAPALRLHHAQRTQGAGARSADGRARGAHRGAGRGGGARRRSVRRSTAGR